MAQLLFTIVALLALNMIGTMAYDYSGLSGKEGSLKRKDRLEMSKTKYGPVSDSCVLDLIIVLDSSVDAGHLYQAVSASSAIIQELPVEQRNARVSVIDYGKGAPRNLFHLDQYDNKDAVSNSLNQIKYTPGQLGCPSSGLKASRDEFNSRSVYRDPLKIVLFFHNGRVCSGDFREANDLRRSGMELYEVDLMERAKYPPYDANGNNYGSDSRPYDIAEDSDHFLSLDDLPTFIQNFKDNFCTI